MVPTMLDGAKVKARRLALELSQRKLAFLVLVKPCTICKIEGNDLRITLDLAKRLAWAIQSKLEDLL